MDRNRFRKRMIFRLANSPWSLLPFTGGATGIIFALILDMGIMGFVSLIFILGSVGSFVTRLIMGDEKVANEVLREIEQEDREQREEKLQDLRRRLEADGDPRTESMLESLLALTERFRNSLKNKKLSTNLNTQSTLDILTGVEELFQGCISYLEQSLELWHAAEEIEMDDAKFPLLERREEILEEDARAADLELEAAIARGRAEASILVRAARSLQARLARLDEDLVRSAEDARRSALAAFREGASDVLRVVDAERTNTESRKEALDLTVEAFLASCRARLAAGLEVLP